MVQASRAKAARSGRFLAFDLGAESSRAIVGEFRGAGLTIRELHRFPTRNVAVRGTQYWDMLFIWGEIRRALQLYRDQYGGDLDGIGVDTWGVDFGVLSSGGHLLANPVQYRDHRTDGILPKAFRVVPRETIYRKTGIQFMPLNTLYQLWAMRRTAPEILGAAATFLLMPDLINYFLTGVRCSEYTEASTTQMLDVRRRSWCRPLLKQFSLPTHILPPIVMPGTRIGPLDADVRRAAGLAPVPVFAPCTHDTGSAVAAVPAAGDGWAYLSCGTWSVLGVELPEPVTSRAALAHNFTNEGGYGGRIRFLKNIIGLWVLQQCRAAWAAAGREYTYDELVRLARAAPAGSTVLNIDDPRYLNPASMLTAIAEQCAATGQPAPRGTGPIVRAVLEGLALRYALVLRELETVLGISVNRVHIVGGGIKNELLCQWAADAMQRPVLAGPVEATAMGNLVVQAMAAGRLRNLDTARAVIGRAARMKTYRPRDAARWQKLLARYSDLYQ
ncbi:rhamnulokinase [bacterium]|nr:rhamnulokinase [bacterium]